MQTFFVQCFVFLNYAVIKFSCKWCARQIFMFYPYKVDTTFRNSRYIFSHPKDNVICDT